METWLRFTSGDPRQTQRRTTSGNLQEIFPNRVLLEADAFGQSLADLILEIASLKHGDMLCVSQLNWPMQGVIWAMQTAQSSTNPSIKGTNLCPLAHDHEILVVNEGVQVCDNIRVTQRLKNASLFDAVLRK